MKEIEDGVGWGSALDFNANGVGRKRKRLIGDVPLGKGSVRNDPWRG